MENFWITIISTGVAAAIGTIIGGTIALRGQWKLFEVERGLKVLDKRIELISNLIQKYPVSESARRFDEPYSLEKTEGYYEELTKLIETEELPNGLNYLSILVTNYQIIDNNLSKTPLTISREKNPEYLEWLYLRQEISNKITSFIVEFDVLFTKIYAYGVTEDMFQAILRSLDNMKNGEIDELKKDIANYSSLQDPLLIKQIGIDE